MKREAKKAISAKLGEHCIICKKIIMESNLLSLATVTHSAQQIVLISQCI